MFIGDIEVLDPFSKLMLSIHREKNIIYIYNIHTHIYTHTVSSTYRPLEAFHGIPAEELTALRAIFNAFVDSADTGKCEWKQN